MTFWIQKGIVYATLKEYGCEYGFFEESRNDQCCGFGYVFWSVGRGLELREELMTFADGTNEKLGKEGLKERKIKKTFGVGSCSSVEIDQIRDRLKAVE